MRYQELLDKDTDTPEQLAKKHGVPLSYIQAQLDRGIRIESEHTTHERVAREIALDHIGEDPNYYKKLSKIDELYDPESSFKLEWDDTFGPEERHARAHDRQGNYIDINFVPVKGDIIEVEFSRNDSYDMTGGGDANRVLGTVLEAFREYLRGYQPKMFVFSAKGGSRSRVYQSLIKRFAASVGYRQFDMSKLSPEKRAKIVASGSDLMVLRKSAVSENFHDGKHPEDKGDSKRHGVPTKASVSSLRKFAKSHSGRAAQLAHWMANMKSGRAKKK